MEAIEKLNTILLELKKDFIGKEDIIDLLGIALIAKENAFILGPPGTAKSAIVRALCKYIKEGKNFEYLLTRFTEPNEIFGPFDIRKLKEGELMTNTEGMLPEASLVFLDEIFNANSAILNSLLMALNERIFRRGKETRLLPALMFVGASNMLPEDEALAALFDRFLIRVKSDYVPPEKLNEVLLSGWKMEHSSSENNLEINIGTITQMQKESKQVVLDAVRTQYIDLILALRNAGIKVSDRRAVKLQNLIAASAYICGRKEAIVADMWVLKYIWDTEEQMEILEGIVNTVIDKEQHPQAHIQAYKNKSPNAEDIMKEVHYLAEQWQREDISMQERNVIKDKLRYVQNRCDWIKSGEQKQFVQNNIDALWKKMLEWTS
jgi:MoxR-like ATPase